MRTLAALVLVLSLGSVAEAKDHPCKRVEAACYAAGYVKGGARLHKGMARDCMAPLLQGQSVPGVSIDPAEVQKCVAARAKHGLPPPPPPPPAFPPPKE